MNQSTAEKTKFDLLIANGTLIDGNRQPRFSADIGIVAGMIAEIGDLAGREAAVRIDASNKIVAPGFIDSHTHDDQAVLSQPNMSYKVSQGVTTVITGNCGISIAPLSKECPTPAPLNLLGGENQELFATFASYLDALRKRPAAVNVAALVGHSTLRAMCMTSLDRAASDEEIEKMQALLEEALQAGALGMSTGTAYPPAMAAPTAEIIAVGQPLSRRKALYVTHMRDEADHSMEALEETFLIGRELNVPVVISHHKLQREKNFGKSAITLPRIKAAMQCQCVALDCYPYNASSTMLHSAPEKLECKVLIASSKTYPNYAGRYLGDIAEEWHVSREEAARRLQPASAVYFSMDQEDVKNILAFDETMIGSDGIPTGEKPHPRLWGTFPRVLGRYSRDLGLFPLETAVWKMTGLTARNFGLSGRGVLAVGNHADIVVFDPKTVKDVASYEKPIAAAEGIVAVIVNGVVAWQDGQHRISRSGMVLVANHAHDAD